MMRQLLAILAAVAIGLGSASAGAATQSELTFQVQRVLSAGRTSVVIEPAEELKRQIPIISARLYGVGNLPSDDPYRAAWNAVFEKVMRPPMVAQVWGDPTSRVVRFAGYVDGKWSDLNAQLVREGAAFPNTEGDRTPYRTEAAEAQRRMIGRYAYRQVAWFWANSTPIYALTATPAPGVRVPVAIAMVSATRIEAGYLLNKRVVLLPTGSIRLGPIVADVASRGPDLMLVMKSWARLSSLRWHWRWDGKAYQLLQAEETRP